MTDQKTRGGQKANTTDEGEKGRHRGVHPGSQQTHGKEQIGHKSGHEKLVPDKDDKG